MLALFTCTVAFIKRPQMTLAASALLALIIAEIVPESEVTLLKDSRAHR